MERNIVVDKLSPLVCKAFGSNDVKIFDEMSSENTEEWTSLSFMMLLSEIEAEFGFKFKMIELIHIKNMGDIIKSIENHINN